LEEREQSRNSKEDEGRGANSMEEARLNERWVRATKPLPFETSTVERLRVWENTLREVEAGEWVAKNLEVSFP
jgi:hypothetical protein